MLGQLGFGKERFQALINRVDGRDGLREADVGKIFNCPVLGSFPNDYFSMDRALAMGEPLEESEDLGRAVAEFAARLAGAPAGEKRRPAVPVNARPVLSES